MSRRMYEDWVKESECVMDGKDDWYRARWFAVRPSFCSTFLMKGTIAV